MSTFVVGLSCFMNSYLFFPPVCETVIYMSYSSLNLYLYGDDNILIKDYDNNIVYFADELGNQISPSYKDIFVLDDAYIVKNEEDKYIIIDKQFNQILNNIEYSYINPLLLDKGILLWIFSDCL